VPYELRARRFPPSFLLHRGNDFTFQTPHNDTTFVLRAEPRKRELRVVLNKLEQIRECLWQAEQCAQKAAERPSGSPLRQAFTQLAKRWLGLARSIEFGEQIDHSRTNAETINRTQSIKEKAAVTHTREQN
jgi:hypothetical protein